jgi:hypothetical protein
MRGLEAYGLVMLVRLIIQRVRQVRLPQWAVTVHH